MTGTTNLISKMQNTGKRFIKAFIDAQEFQQRIWVVSIQQAAHQQGHVLNDTYVISEDNFDIPMQWMHKKGYSADLINKVDKMKPSQVLTLQVNDIQHSLMRVK